jgi:hypothetical protein
MRDLATGWNGKFPTIDDHVEHGGRLVRRRDFCRASTDEGQKA